jgi:predicted transcriptional regulator
MAVSSTEQEMAILDEVIKDFRIAMKNSVMYVANHPICIHSIENLKNTLAKWYHLHPGLELGISSAQIFYKDKPIREKDDVHAEMARTLHLRGIIGLAVESGVDTGELQQFFGLVRQDRRTIQAAGGISKSMPKGGHIQVREIDYSSLLQSAYQGGTATEEGKIWQFLFNIAEESKAGELPSSKVEFLNDFFKDSKRSAKALNKVYRDALSQMQDDNAAQDIRGAMGQICQYLEKHSTEDAKELKVKLMNVISQLHPDLIETLFERTTEETGGYDLVESITKDFSEDYIAEFIESLISSEDTFNENLLKVFDKLAPGQTKANNVVSMVADRLFRKRVINPDTLSQLQMSIMDIFRKHPESDFMNQIYKITVDAVMNKKMDTLVYMARLSPMINKFVQSMEGEQLNTEKIWLLLNILWLENNPEEFSKFAGTLVSAMPGLLDNKDIVHIREIVEFFTEKIRPEQRENAKLGAEIHDALSRITNKKTIDSIISIVPEATQKDLEDIVYTLIRSEADCARTLVDAFIAERNPAHRHKFWFIFSMMKNEVTREAVNRLEYGEPNLVKDLFLILKECDPKKAHLAAKKYISHKNAQVRWEALDALDPRSPEEIEAVVKIYRREKNRSVKKKAGSVIMRTGNPDSIGWMFASCEKDFFHPGTLPELVELCGQARAEAAFPHLQRLYLKPPLLYFGNREELRAAVITSAGRLKTADALDLVRLGLKDKSRRVREMSEIILKLDE